MVREIENWYLSDFCIIPISGKYYSDTVYIVPIIGYTANGREVQNYVYIGKTSRREMGHFR